MDRIKMDDSQIIQCSEVPNLSQPGSEVVNAIHAKEIRTSTYSTVDEFQLRRFCSGRVSQVKRNSCKGYTQINSI